MTDNQTKTLADASSEAKAFIERFDNCFIERTHVSQCLLLASVAELPIVLLGPPGTAKSLMIRGFGNSGGMSFFQYLITKFTTPDELFGQYKISALKKDKLERAWKGTSVDAETIFWDEVFKGGSALLNAMLTALNEKEADIGSGRVPMKYNILAGASNELPEEGQGLEALWDRWAIRVWVDYIKTDAGFERLLTDKTVGKCAEQLDWKHIHNLRKLRDKVAVGGIVKPLHLLKAKFLDSDIVLSDRKWKHVLKALCASAVINNRATVTKSDLKVIRYMAWSTREQIATVEKIITEASAGNSIKIRYLAEAINEIGDIDEGCRHIRNVVNEARKIASDEGWDADCKSEYTNFMGVVFAQVENKFANLNQCMSMYGLNDFAQMAQNLQEVSQLAQFVKELVDTNQALVEGSKRLSESRDHMRVLVTENNKLFTSKTNQL